MSATARLEGKTAIITGGAAGIGRAVAERFLREGAKVVVVDLSCSGLEQLERDSGGAFRAVEGDVRDPATNAEAVSHAVDTFGGVDVVVLNAAVFDGFAPIAELAPDLLRRAALELLDVNVVAYMLGARASAEELARRRGVIILTVSNAAFAAGGGGALYTASKHAVLGLLRQLAYEFAPDVRVNGVAPGGTLTGLAVTPALRDMSLMPTADERAERIRGRNALGIALLPEDVVAPYVLLASDESRGMTGSVIRVDGGVGLAGPAAPATRSDAVAGML